MLKSFAIPKILSLNTKTSVNQSGNTVKNNKTPNIHYFKSLRRLSDSIEWTSSIQNTMGEVVDLSLPAGVSLIGKIIKEE